MTSLSMGDGSVSVMRFSQDFLDKVRDANNLVDVISRYTQLNRAGGRYVGLCPFPDHREKTPSFSVSDTQQLYYCFGCKKGGNIFKFVEAMMGLSFPEAVDWLARQAGIPIPQEMYQRSEAVVAHAQERKAMAEINEFAIQFFESELRQSGPSAPVKEYLKKRGLNDETIKTFRLGYSPNDWEKLSSLLKARRAPLNLAEKLGLIRARSQGGNGYFDLFRHRLMFPIFSLEGSGIGFGGRVLGEGEPKYLNSPESPLFHKGQVFYGLSETAKFIRAQDQAIVVEGYMDLLALYQAGIKNVVAPLGTALTEDHAKLLKRFTKNVIVLFDGDQAGRDAAERSLPILLGAGVLPRGFTLPDKMDPDDFVRTQGAEALKGKLAEAPELFVLILDQDVKGYRGTSAEKVTLIDKMAPVLATVPDSRLRDLYVDEVASRLGVTGEWLKEALAQSRGSQRPGLRTANKAVEAVPTMESTPPPEVSIIKLGGKRPKAEELLVNLALMKPDYMRLIVDLGVVQFFAHAGLREVLQRAILIHGQMPNEFDKLTALLVSQVDLSEVLFLHLENHLENLNLEGAQKLIADCNRKVQDAFLKSQSRQITTTLRGRPAAEQLEKLEQIMNMHRQRRDRGSERDPNSGAFGS